MTIPHYEDQSVRLFSGDCLDVLRTLPDASVDAVVTDPPAGIHFMSKSWDTDHGGRDGFVAWMTERLTECARVMKPGAHAFVWAMPRTSGWTQRAIEDAGLIPRDCVVHLFGTGFPKSHNLPGGLGTALKPASEHWWLARKPLAPGHTVAANVLAHGTGALNVDGCRIGTTDNLNGGAYAKVGNRSESASLHAGSGMNVPGKTVGKDYEQPAGRWPANVVLDESQAAALDEQSGELSHNPPATWRNGQGTTEGWGNVGKTEAGDVRSGFGDTGGASRFFYTAPTDDPSSAPSPICNIPDCYGQRCDCAYNQQPSPPIDQLDARFMYTAKAAADERVRVAGVAHPTVKPLSLMRWLVRLVTPPGGVVLEPFAGSGTTVEACILEGFRCVAIEREADYLPLIMQRIHRRRDPVQAVKGAGEDGGLFDLLDVDPEGKSMQPKGRPVMRRIPGERADFRAFTPEGSTSTGEFTTQGRWPTNVVMDRAAAAELDEQSGDVRSSGHVNTSVGAEGTAEIGPTGLKRGKAIPGVNTYSDEGGASRFFPVFDDDEDGAV